MSSCRVELRPTARKRYQGFTTRLKDIGQLLDYLAKISTLPLPKQQDGRTCAGRPGGDAGRAPAAPKSGNIVSRRSQVSLE